MNWIIKHIKYILIIVLLNVLIYGRTYKFEFTNYDDDRLIVMQEKFLSDFKNVVEAFKRDVFNNADRKVIFYRPILSISFIINYKIFGLNASAFHLMNLAIHVINSILVFFILTLLFNNNSFSLIGAMIFSVHPVQVESVAWLSGRNDLLLGLFTILMLIFYLYSHKKNRASHYLLSVFFFLIAMFTKEPAVFFFLLIVLYDIIFQFNNIIDLLKTQLKKYLVYIGAILFYLLVRYSTFGYLLGSQKLYSNSSIFEHVLNSPLVIGTYLQLLALPINLNVLHPIPSIKMWGGFAIILSTIVITSLIVIAVLFIKRKKYLSFGILFVLISLIPASNILPTPIPILEHRLYVPMIGFSVMIIAMLEIVNQKIKNNIIIVSSGLIIAICLSIISILRLPVWSNSEKLWLDVIKKSPEYDLAYYNLGTYYLQNNRILEAIPYLEQALIKNPRGTDVIMNLGYAYLNAKNYEKAADVYRKLMQLEPYNEQAYIGMGNALRSLRRYQEAIAVYRDGIDKIPNSAILHYELALCYGFVGGEEDAEIALKKSIELNKTYAPAFFSLGGLYSYTGRDSLAIKYIETGLKYGKPAIGVYKILSNSYLKIGDTAKYVYYKKIYNSIGMIQD